MSKPNHVLALDIACTLGWASQKGDVMESGVWRLGVPLRRWSRLWGRLELHRHLQGRPDAVVYERPGHLIGHAKKIMPGIQSIVELWCEKHRIECCQFAPKQIKKFATGNGNANKDLMVEAAKERWPGVVLETHDQADALWLLELFLSTR